MSKAIDKNVSGEDVPSQWKVRKLELLSQIQQYEQQIKQVNQQLNEERPRTSHGKYICTNCDCLSLEFEGGMFLGVEKILGEVYRCVFCKKAEFY